MVKKSTNTFILVVLILIGLLAGSFIGDLFGTIGFLSFGKPIGFEPITLNLLFAEITFGLTVSVNLLSLLAVLIVLVIYKKL